MSAAFERVVLRVVDEIVDEVKPWLAPAVETEVLRQLNADDPQAAKPPTRAARDGSGLRITLTACRFGAGAQTRMALLALETMEDAVREAVTKLVETEIEKQRPVSELAQREFDAWASARRDRAARYTTIAKLQAVGRKFASGEK